MLNPALALHPALVALDLGDCMLGDEAINLICGLLPPDGAKSGEQGSAQGLGVEKQVLQGGGVASSGSGRGKRWQGWDRQGKQDSEWTLEL